jgi:anti-anti-sigma factor
MTRACDHAQEVSSVPVVIQRDTLPGDVVCLRVVLPPDAPEPVTDGPSIDLDLLDSVVLEKAITEVEALPNPYLVLDLTGVLHLHSRGLWAIVEAARRRRERGGATALAGLSAPLARVVELTSAADSVLVANTAEDALSLFPRTNP